MSKQLIEIKTNENGQQLVSGRELHEFLGVKDPFSQWIGRRINKYEFIENVDFTIVEGFSQICEKGGRPKKEYALTIEMAKELSMVENNEKGRQARKYFIECERKLKEQNAPSYIIDDPIERAKVWIKEQEKLREEQAKRLEAETQRNRLMHQNKLYTTTEIAKEIGFKSASELNKKLHEMGVQFKLNNTWVLYARYSDCGYTSIKQTELENGKVIYDRKWTGTGRDFLINLFK